MSHIPRDVPNLTEKKQRIWEPLNVQTQSKNASHSWIFCGDCGEKVKHLLVVSKDCGFKSGDVWTLDSSQGRPKGFNVPTDIEAHPEGENNYIHHCYF